MNSKIITFFCQNSIHNKIINNQKTNKIISNIKSFRTKIFQLTKDRNQPGLHRFELRSCKILMIEQIKILNFCI